MTRFASFLLMLVLGFHVGLVHAQPSPREAMLEVMKHLMADYPMPSMSVAVSIKGEILFAEAMGYADLASKTKATLQTKYSAGSITKPMTTIAMGRLVDAGVLDLDADIHRYLPDYPALEHRLTARQLASHTAGVIVPEEVRFVREFEQVRDHRSPMQALDLFSELPPVFRPGTNYRYDSAGYILLSAVMEAASKQDFVDLMATTLSDLGMTHTTHDVANPKGGGEATYYRYRNNQFEAIDQPWDRSFLFGAGGYLSTPTDLVKMSAAIFEDEMLSAAVKKELLTPVVLPNGEVNEQVYGLGWRMESMGVMQRSGKLLDVIHHGGVMGGAKGGGATCFLLLVPEHKAAVAFMTNALPDKFWQIRTHVSKALLPFLDP